MKVTPIQTSFAAGEISPLLYGQSNTPGYQQGLQSALNCICNSRGPAISRRGSRHIGRVAGNDAKVVTMEVAYDDYFIIGFLDQRLVVNRPYGETIGQQFDETAPWTEDQFDEIQTVRIPQGKAMYLLHPNVAPRKLEYDGSTWSLSTVSFTSQPSEWGSNNWPSTGTHFQGRLYLGSTDTEPQTFWASVSGTDTDFTIGVNDADAFEFTMQDYGEIRWLKGVKNLLIGTENGEHIAQAENGVITPTDIQVLRQSSYGSYSVQSDQVGDEVFYVSPDRTKVRAIQYQWQNNNWLSRDITFFSEHITQGKITETTWAQDPDTLYICVLEDGNMAVCTYDRSNDLYGWHPHRDEDGNYLSASSAKRKGVSEVIIAVQRDAGQIDFEEWNCRSDVFYMDGWVRATGTDLTSLSGLDHLEGETVQVTVDGAEHPDRVVSGGSISLDTPGDEVAAGIGYDAVAHTLPPDPGYRGGTSRTTKKRWNKIFIHLLESSLPLINGNRPPTRAGGMDMDAPPPLTTGYTLQVDLGWDRDGSIKVVQDRPRPLTVLSIFGELNQELT